MLNGHEIAKFGKAVITIIANLTVSLTHIEHISQTTVELAEPGVIVLQLNLTDVTKRPLQFTARLDTDHCLSASSLKLIGEELWLCHGDGITVYDGQWNKLRKFGLHGMATSVAALDTKTVVIATYRGLVISSTSGTCMNVRVVKICIFCKLHILKTWHPTYFRDLAYRTSDVRHNVKILYIMTHTIDVVFQDS